MDRRAPIRLAMCGILAAAAAFSSNASALGLQVRLYVSGWSAGDNAWTCSDPGDYFYARGYAYNSSGNIICAQTAYQNNVWSTVGCPAGVSTVAQIMRGTTAMCTKGSGSGWWSTSCSTPKYVERNGNYYYPADPPSGCQIKTLTADLEAF